MLRDAVAVLDIGSSKVTALIGERAVNKNFSIRSIAERTHEAFFDGQIEDFNSLEQAVLGVLNAVCISAKAMVNELFIGVPGEFLQLKNKQHQILLGKKRRIKAKDVDELYSSAKHDISEENYEIIDRSAVYYLTDGNIRSSEPIGKESVSLSGFLSFYLSDKSFTNAIRRILSSTKIKLIHFVPVPLAESLFLFPRHERYGYVILADIGYISTSVSFVLGDGIIYQGAFPIGGGHIAAYLMHDLNIDFDLAEKLKRNINLSLNSDVKGFYDIFVVDEQYSFDVAVCNQIVSNVLDEISENIDRHLSMSQIKLPLNNSVPLSLTGGGVCFMRGAREYLSKRLELAVNIVTSGIPFMDKPDESSKLSLLDYALKFKEKKLY